MNDGIDIRMEIDAPPAKVFEALTTTAYLEAWFAERAQVSTDEARYDFWGRFTPYAPGPEEGRHRLLSVESNAKLVFRWPVRGAETTVAIDIAPRAGGALLRLKHDAPPRERGDLSLADFWMLSFENLRRFLRDGAAPLRCDYTSIPHDVVELDLEIEASREEVFRGLTDERILNRWIAAGSADVEPTLGGRYRYWDGQGPIKILSIVPNEKLSCSWKYGEDPETVVSWTLSGSEGRTRISLVHSGFGRDVEDFRTGWLRHMLWLKETLEQGESWSRPVLATTDCRA